MYYSIKLMKIVRQRCNTRNYTLIISQPLKLHNHTGIRLSSPKKSIKYCKIKTFIQKSCRKMNKKRQFLKS